MNKDGIKPRLSEKWQRTSISNILRNYAYIARYASYEGVLYELDALNSWYLNRLDDNGYQDYSFKYVSAKVPHPKVPYVGMPETLINFTEIGEYESRKVSEGDSQHKHWMITTYYFYLDGKLSYTVECEHGQVKSVNGPYNYG